MTFESSVINGFDPLLIWFARIPRILAFSYLVRTQLWLMIITVVVIVTRWSWTLFASYDPQIMIILTIMNKLYAIEYYTAHGGPVKGLTLSPNGEYMVSSSFDYSSVIWDTKNLK